MYTAARVLAGTSPGPPLRELVPRVAPTPLLLISAGGFANEARFNRVYADVAREPFELWEVPGVGHTSAIREQSSIARCACPAALRPLRLRRNGADDRGPRLIRHGTACGPSRASAFCA